MKEVYTLDQEKASKARKRMIITYFFAPYILIFLIYLVRVLTTPSSFVTELQELWDAFLIMPFWIVILFFINKRQKKADQAFKVELDEVSVTLHQANGRRIRLEYKEITNLGLSKNGVTLFSYKNNFLIPQNISKYDELKNNFIALGFPILNLTKKSDRLILIFKDISLILIFIYFFHKNFFELYYNYNIKVSIYIILYTFINASILFRLLLK